MSNIIPMVSSSPPPMDEGEGFDWDDDDDDFGTFTSANDSSIILSGTDSSQGTPFKSTPVPDHFNTTTAENNFEAFANFESHSDPESQDSLSKQISKNLLNDSRPECIQIAPKSVEVETNSESNGYQNSDGPLVDSGVYSSNVSPVQHVDSSGSDNVQGHNAADNSKTAQDNTTDELSCTFQGDSNIVEEEKNGPLKETGNDASSIQNDATSSDTQESKIRDESEKFENTEVLEKCIPPTNIPENEHRCKSEIEENNIYHENMDKSANIVILNNDESYSENNEVLESKSIHNKNSNSVSNLESQEIDQIQTVCVSDLTKDKQDSALENDTDLPAESSTDFGDFSSVDSTKSTGEEFVNSEKRTEEESEKDEKNIVDSDPSVDEVTDATETNELDNLGSENDESSYEQSDSITETKTNRENLNRSKDTSSDDGKFMAEVEDKTEHYEGCEIGETETKKWESSSEKENNFENTDDVVRMETLTTEMSSVDDTNSDLKDIDIENDRTEMKYEEDTLNTDANLHEGSDSSEKKSNTQDNSVSLSDTSNNQSDDKGFCAVNETTCTQSSRDEDSDGFGDFGTTDLNSGTDFKASFSEKQTELLTTENKGGEEEQDDDDEFGDFNSSFDKKQGLSISAVDAAEDDFGDFNASFSEKENIERSEEGFVDFNASFDNVPTVSEETSDDWAAFSEPQIADGDNIDIEDDEWAGFEEEESGTTERVEDNTAEQRETDKESLPDLAHMTKHEKLMYAVTTCFPALVSDKEVDNLQAADLQELHIDSDSAVWGHVKVQNTTDALTYQWTKSLWNTRLFSTLHIDTRNILIGHKKAAVPVFAAGLTLLEPTKGQTPLKPEVLVDTSKSDPSLTSHSQIPTTSAQRPNKNESIPAAQFDWSSSGLTNPLEADNKTLNLDFLIQDQATKSNALESEFLSTNESPVHKPAIQPLENILANLKTSSTFKPTNQHEDISQEASKVVHSLPDLMFMKSKVLMFPVKLGGFDD